MWPIICCNITFYVIILIMLTRVIWWPTVIWMLLWETVCFGLLSKIEKQKLLQSESETLRITEILRLHLYKNKYAYCCQNIS